MRTAKIRWDAETQAFLDEEDRILAKYDRLAASPGELEAFREITAGEISDALKEAADSQQSHRGKFPYAGIGISYLPNEVGVFRTPWAANYPTPDDILMMTRERDHFEFYVYIVLPRDFDPENIHDVTPVFEPVLSARGMTCIDTRFFNQAFEGPSLELTVIPPRDATVYDMALTHSHLRDIVMNEPSSATPERAFTAIKGGETHFLLGLAESELMDAKDRHYPKDSRARIDLAADIAAFANSVGGGIIVIGARTVRDPHGHDVIAEVNGCPIDVGAKDRYRSAIQALVYPEILGIEMCRTPSALGEVFAIMIPEQDQDRLPFIVRGVVISQDRMSTAAFQVPVRQGDCNVAARIEDIHRRLQRAESDPA